MRSIIFLFLAIVTLPSSFGVDTCGGEMSTAADAISYKVFQPVISRNERCVWIIHVKGATSYEVNVDFFGLKETEEHLLITSMVRGGTPETKVVSKTVTSYDFPKTSILIVTFASGANIPDNTNGFRITYTSKSDPAVVLPTINPASKYVIADPRTFYTPELSVVDNEFSAFIFPPADGIINPGRMTKLLHIRAAESCGQSQKMETFVFNFNSANWESKGGICDKDYELIETSDLIMVTLSTEVGPYSGFHFVSLSSSC